MRDMEEAGARPSSTRSQISSSIWRVSSSSAVENRVHRHDVKRCIVAQRPERNARVLIDVAFADLDETTELGETRETHRDRFAGERIQHHVHALAIGHLHDGLSKVAAARVDDVFHAERLEKRTFARAAQRWRSLPRRGGCAI